MIFITRTTTGLLIQRDADEIEIAAAALPAALPAVLLCLVESSKATQQARREGYEAGLIQGHEQGRIEAETRHRIEAQRIADGLSLLSVPATLAA